MVLCKFAVRAGLSDEDLGRFTRSLSNEIGRRIGHNLLDEPFLDSCLKAVVSKTDHPQWLAACMEMQAEHAAEVAENQVKRERETIEVVGTEAMAATLKNAPDSGEIVVVDPIRGWVPVNQSVIEPDPQKAREGAIHRAAKNQIKVGSLKERVAARGK